MPKSEKTRQDTARFSYEGLDRVIHEKARLGLLTSLVGHPKGLLFGDLKQLCGLTDGNLSRHLQVLQEEGLVAIDKRFEGNRPQTRLPHYAFGPQAVSRLSQSARTRGEGRRAGSRRRRREGAAASRAGLTFFCDDTL